MIKLVIVYATLMNTWHSPTHRILNHVTTTHDNHAYRQHVIIQVGEAEPTGARRLTLS